MLHGFGRFCNNFLFFLRKMLDALLFSFICHWTIKFFTGEDRFDISSVIILVMLGLGVVLTIVRGIRLWRPANADKPIRKCDAEPDAINVKKKKIRSDINVKVDRAANQVFITILKIIGGGLLFLVTISVGSSLAASQNGSWLAAVVFAAECIWFNKCICRPFKVCKCPVCMRGKAIRLVNKEVLEKKKGDWVEDFEKMDTVTVRYDVYEEHLFGKTFLRTEDREEHVINTHKIVHRDAEFARYSKSYICRYCGQRYGYDGGGFEPTEQK